MHEKVSGQTNEKTKEKEKRQTDWSQRRHRSKQNFEMPNETIKRVSESISRRFRPITALAEPSREEKASKVIKRPVTTLHSQNEAGLRPNQKHFLSKVNSSSVILKFEEMNDDISSTVRTSSIAAQKRDLEVQIGNKQQQIHFLKREGQCRTNAVSEF